MYGNNLKTTQQALKSIEILNQIIPPKSKKRKFFRDVSCILKAQDYELQGEEDKALSEWLKASKLGFGLTRQYAVENFARLYRVRYPKKSMPTFVQQRLRGRSFLGKRWSPKQMSRLLAMTAQSSEKRIDAINKLFSVCYDLKGAEFKRLKNWLKTQSSLLNRQSPEMRRSPQNNKNKQHPR